MPIKFGRSTHDLDDITSGSDENQLIYLVDRTPYQGGYTHAERLWFDAQLELVGKSFYLNRDELSQFQLIAVVTSLGQAELLKDTVLVEEDRKWIVMRRAGKYSIRTPTETFLATNAGLKLL